jgi:apolipoprotein N-acyltransferase
MLFWQRVEEQKNFDFSHSPLRVALCQMEEPPDVFSKGLSPEELHVKEWTKIFSILSTLRAGQVDLIILPEGAVPFPAQAALYDARRLPEEWLVSSTNKHPMLSSLDICRLIAWSKQSSILIGLEGHTLDPFSRLVAYNSMYCISPKQKKITRYDKQLLIPLGEYIPSEQFRTWLSQYGIHESFTPGEGPVLLTANTIQIAPFICYEEIFSSYVVEAARLQPNLLTSVSNDNWFPSIRTEHFELARLRTAEVGIPLLRSCNQGVSAAIDSLGRTIVSRGETQEKDNGYIIANVSLYSAPSFFLEFGNEFIVTILAFIAIVTLTPVPKKQKHFPLR